MSTFQIHTADTAPEAKTMLDGAQASLGFVPNLFGTMAEAPALLEGYLAMSAIFDKTDLTVTGRQIVLMTNNLLNNCSYCMAAHSTISKMQGIDADVIESLRTGSPLADPKLEALRVFSAKINESKGWADPADVNAFLAAGYTQRNVFEVILGTSFKVMSNYTNHLAGTPVDPAFAPMEWTKEMATVSKV